MLRARDVFYCLEPTAPTDDIIALGITPSNVLLKKGWGEKDQEKPHLCKTALGDRTKGILISTAGLLGDTGPGAKDRAGHRTDRNTCMRVCDCHHVK